MAARSGLFVDPVPGNPPVGTSMADGRRVLGAAFGAAFKPISGGTLTVSGSTMAVTVAQSVWAIPDPLDAASSFLSPSDTTVVTPAAGPSTGSRIDLILVKQNNYAGGDVDSRANVYLKAGAAASSPVPPAVDAGAQVVATIAVPTNAATSSACTITYGRPQTVSQVPQVTATTYALLTATSGERVGQLATVTADAKPANNGLYVWSGSIWIQMGTFGGGWQKQIPSAVGGGTIDTNGDAIGTATAGLRLDGIIDWTKWYRYRIIVAANANTTAGTSMYLFASFGGVVETGTTFWTYAAHRNLAGTGTDVITSATNAAQITPPFNAINQTAGAEVLISKQSTTARMEGEASGGVGAGASSAQQTTHIDYGTTKDWTTMDGLQVQPGSGTATMRVAVWAM